MVFVSDSFVFLFLPLFLLIYAIVPARCRNATILVFSLIFYGWWRFDFLPLLIVIACWSWATGLWIVRSDGRERRIALLAAIGAPLASLIWFKYANLLAETLLALGAPIGSWTAVPLPIGLSFFVFGAISYSVDVFRKTVAAEPNLVNYATYQAMFGHLVAGPVVRYQSVAERLTSRSFNLSEFTEGWRRFMLGFALKVLLGDTLAPLVDAGYALPNPGAADVALTVAAYTLHLYFDFAGYSSMAIGLGLMVGLKFPENFDNPYLSKSITEFWRRWHISLSSWLRDYLYIPLGGNRAGKVRSYFNLLVTMALGGLWHGANWTFLVWGLWHGLGLIAARLWSAAGAPAIPAPISHILTMMFVMIGWLLFRAQDWQVAQTMMSGLLGFNGLSLSSPMRAAVRPTELLTLCIGLLVVYAPLLASYRVQGYIARPPFELALLLWLCALWTMQSRTVIPFLYFQF
ncbi:MBOAT family O-acyltransferase [Bradyrhizobium guangdongense]|uniref:Probable alginate O-acetylase AlgI n=1 Tax=Bradyrhizobium guangdongense TaxID=1325090 RepID=A0A410V4A5_9BRAD|nr:MBOAT family O-acyltransferase [Bradyrhizobium guangdongense]QAU38523.1 MBOAT family protein [Bradyrhizobium guangdongense]QOZ59583.1 MBOAT family protein [Bradyrhizobium guangdongense]GGI34540.1 cellulose acetylase [Bradyrhizobium guangdongense]